LGVVGFFSYNRKKNNNITLLGTGEAYAKTKIQKRRKKAFQSIAERDF
jgi:serine kinase of HPr protein (carbohydrate metabolism regulator)